MSPDMFHDAVSSTSIPVFTIANEGNKNESQNLLQGETESNSIQNELIKIDFDKQTVSARTLHDFLGLTERFSKWFQRMISYGLVENVDFTVVPFWVSYTHKWTEDFKSVPNGTDSVLRDIGDYLLTIDTAKHVAMVQRSEKGKQARNYFINIEKAYMKSVEAKNQKPEPSFSLLENLNNIVAQFDNLKSSIEKMEKENAQQQQMQKNYDSLVEKTKKLEKQFEEQEHFHHLKEEYIERTISKKIDTAIKTSFREADKFRNGDEFVNTLPRTANHSTVPLNPLEKNLHKTTLEEDLISQYYLPAYRKTENAFFLTATEITLHLENFNKRVTVCSVGMALKKLGFERVPHSQKGGKVKGYFVVPL